MRSLVSDTKSNTFAPTTTTTTTTNNTTTTTAEEPRDAPRAVLSGETWRVATFAELEAAALAARERHNRDVLNEYAGDVFGAGRAVAAEIITDWAYNDEGGNYLTIPHIRFEDASGESVEPDFTTAWWQKRLPEENLTAEAAAASEDVWRAAVDDEEDDLRLRLLDAGDGRIDLTLAPTTTSELRLYIRA